MRRSRILLAAAAVTGGYVAKRSLDARVASWSTNPDTTDGDPMTMPEGTPIEVTADDGAVLRGLDCGSGPTVMLVHCWTGTMGFWAPVARRLVDAGFRVVAVDQRGHGGSSRGDAPYRPETLGSDVRRWVEELDLRDIVLGGHSMGGLASIAFSCQNAELATERVKGMVLVATLAAPIKDPRLPDIDIDVPKFLPLADRLMRPVDYGLFGLLGVFGTRPARSQMEAARAGWYGTDPGVRREAAVMMMDFDLRPELANIDVPTKVIAGTHDQLTHLPGNEEIAEMILGAEIDVLPGLGHMLPWEAPEQVTEQIIQLSKR
jgi:non-heme chloroperoxidase